MSRKIQYDQPEPGEIVAEERRRLEAEQAARGVADGRYIRRRNRNVSVGLKTSEAKKQQFDRLRLITTWSYTEIFEKALDTFDEWWKQQKGIPKL